MLKDRLQEIKELLKSLVSVKQTKNKGLAGSSVFGMWYVVCGMWYVVCGMWYVKNSFSEYFKIYIYDYSLQFKVHFQLSNKFILIPRGKFRKY